MFRSTRISWPASALGREFAYTGQELPWDQTVAAVQDLNPGPLAQLEADRW